MSTTWINNLSTETTEVDYTPILNQLNQQDGYCLQELYERFCCLKTSPISVPDTLTQSTQTINCVEAAVASSLCFNLNKKVQDSDSNINLASLSKLISLGLVFSQDNVHFGLTTQGLQFILSMQE